MARRKNRVRADFLVFSGSQSESRPGVNDESSMGRRNRPALRRVVLVVAGLNASDSLADRWSNFFTGHYTDTTVWYLVGGGAAAIGGLILVASGRRRI
jgi:hypothetical protein